MSKTPEATVRDPSIAYSKRFGDVKHKRMHFGYGAARSWPDDLFIFADGHHWWVEFKRPKGEATPSQSACHTEMREFKADVSVINDTDDFIEEHSWRRARVRK